jgi:hypothetical protein
MREILGLFRRKLLGGYGMMIVAEIGTSEMLLDYEPTYVMRPLPRLEEISRDHTHKKE